MKTSNSIGWRTATALVIANMIGAGIFTSLGFQLAHTQNTWAIGLLWVLGALMALCGALSYAELGSRWPRSGGEYHFLSRAFHPFVGYLSGWVSLTVGFSAPVALSGMALGAYIGPYLGIPGTLLATLVILAVSLFHSFSIRRSGLLQNYTTLVKVLLIGVFLLFGLSMPSESTSLVWDDGWKEEILMPAFAVSFVFVTFSYSGWNAAAYVVDEIRNAPRNLPRALVAGTVIVSIFYLLLNYMFLKHNSLESIQGELEIGQITAVSLLGDAGGEVISLGIGLLLVSSISAMVWAGPRVTQVMGEDHGLWAWFARKTNKKIPLRALWLQTGITLALLWSGTFEQVVVYSGFVLQLFAALSVAGVFMGRHRSKERPAYTSPFYPLTQIIFLALSLWVLAYLLVAQPLITGLGLLNLVLGAGVYMFGKLYGKSGKK